MEKSEIVDRIVSIISHDLLKDVEMRLEDNKSDYDSIIITTPPSSYCLEAKDFLFARIKTTGKLHYISFAAKFASLFRKAGISISKIKSNPDFFRIELPDFEAFLGTPIAPEIIEKIYVGTFNFEPFGCCSRYKECSELRRCIHPHNFYATACQYRKNLESEKNFYGIDKSV